MRIDRSCFGSALLALACLAPGARAQVQEYEDEATFLADLASMGYTTVFDGFESGAWESIRSPTTAPSVTNLGLTWTGNGPLSTNDNWSRTGQYGLYTSIPATGPEVFRIESAQTLYAAGGWIRASQTDIGIRIGGVIVGERPAPHYQSVFLGVIDTRGFTAVEFIDIEQHAVMGADDFTFALAQACYADCDGNTALDIFDFLCFQDAFVLADPYADCDGNSTFDIFDFLCFQDEFVTGCP